MLYAVPFFKNIDHKSVAKIRRPVSLDHKSVAKIRRPVSLCSVASKIFEKFVNNRHVDHLEKCILYFYFQYGFSSPHLTVVPSQSQLKEL